jgi:hypothetical protein
VRRHRFANAVHLIALDVNQDEVGRRAADLCRELGEQVGLHRPHGQHEETAQAHGHQDDARLVARPREADHGVTGGNDRDADNQAVARQPSTGEEQSWTPPGLGTNSPPARTRPPDGPIRGRTAWRRDVRLVGRAGGRSRPCHARNRRRTGISSSGTRAKSSDTKVRPPLWAAEAVMVIDVMQRLRTEAGTVAPPPPAARRALPAAPARAPAGSAKHLPRRRAQAPDRDASHLLLHDHRVTLQTPMPPAHHRNRQAQ